MKTRSDFYESWLREMPEPLNIGNTYNELVSNIQGRLKYGEPIQIKNNVYKISGIMVSYYWVQDGEIISLAVEIEKKPQVWAVTVVAKNPDYKGKPPYASELYSIIANDIDVGLRLSSDNFLSDEGYSIWKKLFNDGHKISVYN